MMKIFTMLFAQFPVFPEKYPNENAESGFLRHTAA
jgi:hypothetical protein